MPAPARQDKTAAFSKNEVAATYDSLPADQKKRISDILEEITSVPVGPLTTEEVATAYAAFDDAAKDRVSQVVRRLEARAARA